MSIELHCQHCNKLVRAPDGAAGKRAKCPYCQQEVYVRTPPEAIEPLELAPLDDDWQERQKRLESEAKAVSEALLHEKGVVEDAGAASAGAEQGAAYAGPASSGGGVEALVVEYLLAMKDSRLPEAEHIRNKLRDRSSEAKDYAQRLSLDPMPPPELADVPPTALRGLLKSLLSQL